MRKILCEACPIRHISIIADLPDDRLAAFRAFATTAIYKSRQVIFHEGAPASGLHVVCNGAVKLYQSDRFGRDHIVSVAGPGDILGELPVDLAPHSVSAEALTDSQLCYLPREGLLPFIQDHPLVGVRLIAALSAALSVTRRKVRTLALKSAESRLAELLVRLAGNGKERSRFTLRYSRRELAEMIGVSTETVIRLLARLKKKRVISTSHRELIIADADTLGRIASDDGTSMPAPRS